MHKTVLPRGSLIMSILSLDKKKKTQFMKGVISNYFFQDDIKDYLTSQGVDWEESADLLEVASKCDVLYQTRIQRERFGERIDLYEEARGKYIVDLDVMRVMQKHAVVMHPLPRLDEVSLTFF